MPAKQPRSYQLSSALVASSVGAGVVCLAPEAMGRTFRLHAARPGAELNRPVRADLPSGAAHVIAPVAQSPKLVRVDISGPIEQRAGYHDPCGGWTDGNDAITERLCAALAEGDVLLVLDTPGGAAAGIEQGIARVLAAKVANGRRITGFADEQIGSLGMWWALAICDELYIPTRGQIGSIGARGGHESIAGMLAQQGREVTFFTWPNDGKIAFAPEKPLDEVGKARGARDVALAGEAFCAAICAGPVGLRHGLDRDQVVALGADMLTGEAAEAAGLCDGVSSFEDVTAYALSLAELGPVKSAAKDSAREARARGKGTMGTRAEEQEDARARAGGDEPPPGSKPGDGGDPTDPDDAAGREIPTKCGRDGCGVENDKDAKFCKGCGASMATGEPEATAAAAPSSKPFPPKSSARSLSTAASFAEIFGLPADASVPAQKTAALGWRRVMAKVEAMTGRKDPDEMIGALLLVEQDASKAVRYRAERNKLITEGEERDRLALAHRLVAAGEPRDRVFVDVVGVDGKRTGVKLSDEVSELRLKTLRAKVEGLEARKQPVNPFQPDQAAAAARAGDVARTGGLDKATRIKAAEKDPTVIKMYENEKLQGGKTTLEQVATAWIETLDGGAK